MARDSRLGAWEMAESGVGSWGERCKEGEGGTRIKWLIKDILRVLASFILLVVLYDNFGW